MKTVPHSLLHVLAANVVLITQPGRDSCQSLSDHWTPLDSACSAVMCHVDCGLHPTAVLAVWGWHSTGTAHFGSNCMRVC